MQIIKDGEGISKFVTIKVTSAVSDASAKRIAMSIANSPLVKTAIAGQDANWGRIVMAVGKAGEPAKRDKLTIHIGPHLLAQNGQPSANYAESDGEVYMRNSHIDITVDMGLKTGDDAGQATVYTCDLTHQYIDINADYRS
jgi:glutamate N-acetyltransferase/amino-acid N-acetyltransferase